MGITFHDTHFWLASYGNRQVSEYDCHRRKVAYELVKSFSLMPKGKGPTLTMIKPEGYRLMFAARRFGDIDLRTGKETDEGTDYELGLVKDDGRSELAEMERGGLWPPLDFSGGFLIVFSRFGDVYLKEGRAKMTKFDNKYIFEVA
jgi:hypothetical protein